MIDIKLYFVVNCTQEKNWTLDKHTNVCACVCTHTHTITNCYYSKKYNVSRKTQDEVHELQTSEVRKYIS